jgi:hypothetical protein
MATTRYIVLPVVGKPYILSDESIVTKNGKTDSLETIQKIVEGDIERFFDKVRVHPMFHTTEEWKEVDDLLKTNKACIYVNENGLYRCSANLAIVLAKKPPPGYPFTLHGNVCLQIKGNTINALPSLQTYKYNENPIGEDEEEDEEEESEVRIAQTSWCVCDEEERIEIQADNEEN